MEGNNMHMFQTCLLLLINAHYIYLGESVQPCRTSCYFVQCFLLRQLERREKSNRLRIDVLK